LDKQNKFELNLKNNLSIVTNVLIVEGFGWSEGRINPRLTRN